MTQPSQNAKVELSEQQKSSTKDFNESPSTLNQNQMNSNEASSTEAERFLEKTQHDSSTTNERNVPTEVSSANQFAETIKMDFDILLNNFQIKKKRYRVLFNCDHIVWERLPNTKQRCQQQQPQQQQQQPREKSSSNSNKDDIVKVLSKKEVELETEHLSNSNIKYGNNSHVLHVNEIIRVTKGETKAATLRIVPPQNCDEASDGVAPPSPRRHDASSAQIIDPAPKEQYLTIHYAERVVKSKTDCNRWHIRSVTMHNSDAYIIRQWHDLLVQKLDSSPLRLRIKRMLVFINPYGGKKEALNTYERYCKPVFHLAGIDASCVISQRANQIRDILMSHDLSLFDAICCVGGDGTVAECVNGLLFRTIRDKGLDPRKPAYIPKPKLPIGIIPAGSTDTIVYSAHGTSDPLTAAIHIILGQRRGCDICSVRNSQGIVRFCASLFSYGYLGDVAAKSEKYRWMGTKRYEYTGVKAFLLNRSYEAELHILEDNLRSDDEPHTSKSTLSTKESTPDTICYAGCQRCSTAGSIHQSYSSYTNEMSSNMKEEANVDNETLRNDIKNEVSDESDSNQRSRTGELLEESNGALKENSSDKNCDNKAMEDEALHDLQRRSTSPGCISDESDATINSNSDGGDIKHKWKVIRGKFFMISGANITCACSRSPNGIARFSHLGDGQLDLILVRKTSIFNNIRFAMNTMGQGDIRNLPFVETYRTRKFHFRAHGNDDSAESSIRGSCQPIAEDYSDAKNEELVSSWNCDGEVVYDLDVTMNSHCQLIDVFMRGPYAYSKSAHKRKHSVFGYCCCCCS